MRGAPFIHINGRVAHHHVQFKFPPDWWWRRYCRRGTCAYYNFMCPNGCPEEVDLDFEVRAMETV